MGVAAHLLTSFVLARAFFPRRSWPFDAGVMLAGTLADADLLTLLFGPGVYLAGHLTVTHSVPGTVVVIAIAAAYVAVVQKKSRSLQIPPGQEVSPAQASFATILLATSLAAIVHLLMDCAGSFGIALLWPFRTTRFAWDCLPYLDPWTLFSLAAGLLLPELFDLIRSEIGAKSKTPRGRNGAIAAVVMVLLVIGTRATLHSNAMAQLDAHTYRGESPRRVAAFPDSFAIVNWHGVVETATQICTVSVPATQSSRFDPERAACTRKPEDSPALAAAQETETAKQFLLSARFPKASVVSIQGASEVVIRDVRDAAPSDKNRALAARILLDPNGRVISQEIVWASSIRLR